MNRRTTHRAETGRYYAGQAIHAAPGVHEYAAELVSGLLSPGARILEVGAGSGALALRLRDWGFHVVATDLDPAHEWIARLDLDNPDESIVAGGFDLILCIETLEHVENPRGVLRSLRSLMRQGDRLVVSTPNVNGPHSRLKALVKGRPVLFGPEEYYSTGHITPLPDWLLVEHLRSTGFGGVQLHRAGGLGYETRARRAAYRIELGLLRVLGVREDANSGDGSALFAVAVAE